MSHSTNGLKRDSENKEKTKDTKKGRQNAGDLFVYKKNVKKRSKCEVFHYKSL